MTRLGLCDVLKVPEKLPNVVCPVCDVHGVLTGEGENIKVIWNEEEAKYPRFSPKEVSDHLEEIKQKHIKYFQEEHEKVQEMKEKYKAYGNIVKP